MKITKTKYFILCLLISFSLSSQELLQKQLTSKSLTSVSFSDSLHGWIVGEPNGVFHTTDGGASWDSVIMKTGLFDNYQTCVASPSPKTVWITEETGLGDEYLLKSNDAGNSWDTVLTASTNHIGATYLNKVSALDSMQAWVVGDISFIAQEPPPNEKTTDGGLTWHYYTLNSNLYDLEDIEYLSDSVAMVLAGYQILYRSVTGGSSWQADTIASFGYFNSISAIDSNRIWLAGYYGKIIKTADGGKSWISLNNNSINTLNAIHAVDSLNVWAIGNGGTILRSSNGGDNWDSIPNPNKINLNALCFSDRNHGWIVGDSGVIIQFTNGVFTNVKSSIVLPNSFELYQNYPNPFNPTTTISFVLKKKAFFVLEVFNLLGEKIATLASEELAAGAYTRQWNASDFASGVYFCQMRSDQKLQTIKLILLR